MKFMRPEVGEKRIVKKFALFPKKSGRLTVWFEFIYVAQTYVRREHRRFCGFYTDYFWEDDKWVDKKCYKEYKKEKKNAQKSK